jgi:hypothetical protein
VGQKPQGSICCYWGIDLFDNTDVDALALRNNVNLCPNAENAGIPEISSTARAILAFIMIESAGILNRVSPPGCSDQGHVLEIE